ncbi:lipid II flippase MurJ [Yeosuana sp. MJ-SS3]|uniref:Lipid II flippase MurJ n=1 Tax=Gilvirhabdus luticola TaxID=3079858 RepID=A0ABU3U6W4_9FLAO|nr:lipid II flippase MurJ [Yeosuana sp. MJ-SS3]MDU8886143.1 lipid II flippase MurJ [Yeosuana sp. MJ-SS3]
MTTLKDQIISNFKRVLKSPTTFNIITVVIITVVVKGFGFYKEVVVAGSFGLSELLDTFYIAALLPGFINQVFLIAFKAVFIPNYIAESKTTKNIGSFQSMSFLVTIATGLFFILIAYLITDVFLDVFFKGHTESYYQLIKIQFYYLVPCILLWGLSSLLSGLLNVYHEFRHSSIYPVLTSVAMLICLIFFKDELQETVLAVGMLIGCVAEVFYLAIVCLIKKVIKLAKPSFSGRNVQIMFKQLPARISSGLLTGLIPVTDQFFSAQLIIGSIAALNYGMKIPAFFSTLIIMALGSVLLPYFSNLIIDNKENAFKQLNYILKLLFFGLILIVIPLLFFSTTLIELLFERNEFTHDDTIIVASVQNAFLIAIPFAVCGDVIVRFLTSINKNAFLAYVSLGSVILNIIFDFILMKFYGILGIAICTLIIEIIKSFFLLKFVNAQKKIFLK